MLQAATPRPSSPSPSPSPDLAPAPFVVDVASIPRTAQQVQGLRIRIEDLRDQLQDAASRRQNIARQLVTSDPSARAGTEARMGELDSRILRIEKDISEAVRQLSSAPAEALTAAQRWPARFPDRMDKDIIPMVAIISVFVLFPFSVAMSRFIWKRASVTPVRAVGIDQATAQRLEQLQQSVDTIAIEVERISEGQRFVTRLLSDRPVISAGAAEPSRAAKKTSLPSERG